MITSSRSSHNLEAYHSKTTSNNSTQDATASKMKLIPFSHHRAPVSLSPAAVVLLCLFLLSSSVCAHTATTAVTTNKISSHQLRGSSSRGLLIDQQNVAASAVQPTTSSSPGTEQQQREQGKDRELAFVYYEGEDASDTVDCSYGNGAGWLSRGKCQKKTGTSCEKSGLLWYKSCRSGYYAVGPVCWVRPGTDCDM